MRGSSSAVVKRARVNCKARSSQTGLPCKNPAMQGQVVCRMHGGSTKASRAKAQERIMAAADPAAANLVKWMNDGKVEMSLRIRIAQDLLNRANISGVTQVEVEGHMTFDALVAGAVAEVPDGAVGHLTDYRQREAPEGMDDPQDDVIDAELLDEDDHPGGVPHAPVVPGYYDRQAAVAARLQRNVPRTVKVRFDA